MLQKLTNYYIDDGARIIEKAIPIADAIERYKANSSAAYPADFFHKLIRCRDWQIAVGEEIGKKYGITSVVDFGCGLGFYIDGIKRSGATNVLGFEISYDNAREYMSPEIVEHIRFGNAMDQISCGKFDISMSIEVAEHILSEKSDILVDNLVEASSKYIFFSAAVPGQGGTCHINEQPKKYWIDKIEGRGFLFSQKDTNAIVAIMNALPFHSKYYNLMKKQIMFFVRR
jgi:SAM-dependent methyltransferase